MLTKNRQFKFSLIFIAATLLSSCTVFTSADSSDSAKLVASFTVPFAQCDEIVECARVSVPRDYQDESQGSMELAVYRRAAKGNESRTLLVHPGGPGGDVRKAVTDLAQLLGPDADKFTVVGLATRGFQDVEGANCGDTLDDFQESIDDVLQIQQVANMCMENSPQLINSVGTRDSVEDLEQLRILLEIEKWSYLGWSYGATLGATYAMTYPDSIESMVLDAPSDPRAPWATSFELQQDQQLENLRIAIDKCDVSPTCPLAGNALTRITSLQQKLNAAPVAVRSSTVTVNGRAVAMAIELAAYSGDYQEVFSAIAMAEKGEVSSLFEIAQGRLGRSSTGGDEGGMETQTLVRCSDMSHSDAEDVVKATKPQNSLYIGIGPALERICLVLPETKRPLRKLVVSPKTNNVKVLIVATSGDPVMPAQVSQQLATDMSWGFVKIQENRHLSVGSNKRATSAAMACLLKLVCR